MASARAGLQIPVELADAQGFAAVVPAPKDSGFGRGCCPTTRG